VKHSTDKVRFGLFFPVLAFVCFTVLVVAVSVTFSKNNPRNAYAASASAVQLSASSGAQSASSGDSSGASVNTSVNASADTSAASTDSGTLDEFIAAFGLSRDDYPTKLLELLERNPDTAEYVMNYPLKKDKQLNYSLSEYQNCTEVPLLLQWDERWGYLDYGGELMGLSGCGPTALSMVCMYLLQDTTLDPAYIAKYSVENGYRVQGNGTSWALMSKGARDFGLQSEELTLSESQVLEHLEKGDPVICVVGPGDFTDTGHFIVMTGIEDGKIRLNDPNSPTRSEMLWTWDRLSKQIKNLWALSK